MSNVQFQARSGVTPVTVQLRNVATLEAIGDPFAVTEVGSTSVYRGETAQTGYVFMEADATNFKVVGYWDLDRPSNNGFCELFDRLCDAQQFRLGQTLRFADSDEAYNVTISRPS